MKKHDQQDLLPVIGSLLDSISELQRQCGELNSLLALKLKEINPTEQSKLLGNARDLAALSVKTRQEAELFAIPGTPSPSVA